MAATQKKFNMRGLTSLFATYGFILLAITGIILYIVPAGRIAYWVEWQFLGLGKEHWGQIHILSCIMFLIAGGFHIYFNWKPLVRYFVEKANKGLGIKKELVVSTLVTLVIVFAAINRTPPFHYIFEWEDAIKNSWIISEEYEPPFGHAELTSLKSFTKKQGIDLKQAESLLKQNNIEVERTEDSMGKIANNNNISPMELYRMIKPLEKQEKVEIPREFTVESVENLLEGKGIGRKNINYLVKEFKLDLAKVQRRLKANGITYELTESFHDIADRHDTNPVEIVKVILVKGHHL
jgi:hypothetical protein